MKKIILVTVTLLLIAVGAAFAAGLEVKQKADNYNITFVTNRNPLVVGDNAATITIKDSAGMEVTDAKVELDYFMPSMPSMNYTASANLEKTGYTAVIKPTMAGEWKLNVKFAKPGEKAHKTTLLFKAK